MMNHLRTICLNGLLLVTLITTLWVKPTDAQDFPPEQASAILWSADGNRLAIGTIDGTIYIHHRITGAATPVWSGHQKAVTDLAWNSDETQLVSAGADAKVRIWDVSSGNLIHDLIGFDYSASTVVWRVSDNHIIGGSSYTTGGDTVQEWDANSGNFLNSYNHGMTTHLELSLSNNLIASAGGDIVNFRDPLSLTAQVEKVYIAEDGYMDSGWVESLAWHPTENKIAIGLYNGHVRIWDLLQKQVLLDVFGSESDMRDYRTTRIPAVNFSPDGRFVSSVSADGLLRTWEVETGTFVGETQLSGTPIYAAAFSPDGTEVAYGDENGVLQIVPVPVTPAPKD